MARIRGAALVLLVCLVAIVTAWSSEDHEIFRLQDEVAQHEGSNATFYSFVGVTPSASLEDINKAYRKRSRLLHPDKARQNFIAGYDTAPPTAKAKKGDKPTVHVHKNKKPSQREITAFNKEASQRFARLGIVTNILRGPERERYDHFLRNGFPKWRGTGYYYKRFRPGLISVMFGLFIFVGGGVHYVALYLGWKRQREFVDRYIRHARHMAWGDETSIGAIPGLGSNATPVPEPQAPDEEPAQQWNRREKRARERENKRAAKKPRSVRAAAAEDAKNSGVSTPVEAEITSGPVGAKKRTVAKNGKVLIVDSVGNVYLEEETEEGEVHEFLLDVEEIPKPTINDTVLVRLPIWIYNRSLGKVLGKRTEDAELEELLEDDHEDQADENVAALKSAAQPNANAEARKRKLKPGK